VADEMKMILLVVNYEGSHKIFCSDKLDFINSDVRNYLPFTDAFVPRNALFDFHYPNVNEEVGMK